jgi:hypothetical protein
MISVALYLATYRDQRQFSGIPRPKTRKSSFAMLMADPMAA